MEATWVSYMGFGLGGVLLGLLVGFLIARRGGDQGSRQRLTQQLDQLRNEHTRYQAEVNEHFMETAQRIRSLNEAYREMHEHLAQGASRLCNEGDWQEDLLPPDSTRRLAHSAKEADDNLEPPRDYAPKEDPDAKGTLSENYGLDTGKP